MEKVLAKVTLYPVGSDGKFAKPVGFTPHKTNYWEVDCLSHSSGPIGFLHFLQAEQELASNNARLPIGAMGATPDKCCHPVGVTKL